MDAAGVDRVGELDHVTRALDVRHVLRLGARGDVVDRREVEEVLDVTAQPVDVLGRDPEDAVGVGPPTASKLLQPTLRALADQHVEGPLSLEQQLDEVAADEPGRSGDEVAHSLRRSYPDNASPGPPRAGERARLH